jgi:CubicO group peptidase (beta-lactamase class C family)
MGDVLPAEPLPGELDQEKVTAAVDAAFEPPESLTGAFVVIHRGRIIGERYMEGKNKNTMFESWSMGKSLTATFMGILIEQGIYDLWQPAPIPEWQGEGDPRASIRIADIMRMSSGLRFRAPQDPDFDPSVGYADHIYVYTGTIDAFHWSATRPQQWEPNTVGRYRNCDPALINYLVRLAVEARGEDYHTFPQRQLFAKLGIRDMVLETDPYGNFLIQGYEFGSGRAWARLGNLYLQDGVWNDERILPEGFAEFVSTLAPAWEADGRPIYGGFFWINGEGRFPVPRRRWPIHHYHSVTRSRRCAFGTLQGFRSGWRGPEPGLSTADGGGSLGSVGCGVQFEMRPDRASTETIWQADGGAAFPPAAQCGERSWKAGRIT